MSYLSFDEVAKELGISRKALENYVKIGEEIKAERLGRRYVIPQAEVERWKALRAFRTVMLDREDYIKCFEFAVQSFYHYPSTSDFLGSRERGIGKWAEDFIPGKLGEIAVAKFLKLHFKVNIKLDFSIGQGIPAQDIIEVAKPRRGPDTYNPPRIRTSIKTTKIKNVWLAVPEKEFKDPARASEAYILVRLDLPLNHLARFQRETPLFERLRDLIPVFEEIPAEVVGYAWRDDFKHYPNGIPEASIERPHYALKSGQLRASMADWNEYIDRL